MTNVNALVLIGRYMNQIAGKYWTHNPSCENDPYNFVDEPHAQDHGEHNTATGSCGCNSFSNSIQCHGFALYLANLVFGSYPNIQNGYYNGQKLGNWIVYTPGNYGSISLESGDFVRIENSSLKILHSAIVHGVDANGKVTVAECLGSKNSVICLGSFNEGDSRFVTESQLKTYATYIIKAPKTTTSLTSVNVSYVANDSTTSENTTSTYYGVPYMTMPTPTRSGFYFLGWWPEKTSCSEMFAREIVVPAYAHTLYAHWGKEYVIRNVASSKNLTYNTEADEPGNGVQLKIASSNEPHSYSQRWCTAAFSGTQVLKSRDNIDFGISYRNGSAKLMRTFRNENNSSQSTYSIIKYENIGTNKYRIKLNTTINSQALYLTASSTAGGTNCIWSPLDSTNTRQHWEFLEY